MILQINLCYCEQLLLHTYTSQTEHEQCISYRSIDLSIYVSIYIFVYTYTLYIYVNTIMILYALLMCVNLVCFTMISSIATVAN